MFDTQETFNTVATHLFTQGKRAASRRGACGYRRRAGNKTMKCAIGCLIPDTAYRRDMEGIRVFRLLVDHPDAIPGFSKAGRDATIGSHVVMFLTSLQSAHDDRRYWQTTDSMRAALANVAEVYGLDAGVLDRLQFKDR